MEYFIITPIFQFFLFIEKIIIQISIFYLGTDISIYNQYEILG